MVAPQAGPPTSDQTQTYGLSILSPTISPPQIEPKPYSQKLATHADERWLTDFISGSPTAVSTNETVAFGRITFPHSIMSTLKEPATTRIVFDVPATRNTLRFDRAWNPDVYQTNHHGVIRAYHNGQLVDTMDVHPGLLQSKTLSVPGAAGWSWSSLPTPRTAQIPQISVGPTASPCSAPESHM